MWEDLIFSAHQYIVTSLTSCLYSHVVAQVELLVPTYVNGDFYQ